MKFPLFAGLAALWFCSPMPAAEVINLAGAWHVALDRTAVGETERWFARELTDTIELPGSLQQARLGDPVTPETQWTGSIIDRSYFTAPRYAVFRQPGNIKVPFWLQPETHYTGAAWYQREIVVPDTWHGRHVVLSLERPHWKTKVWLDDQLLGANDSLSVPHVFELGAALRAGTHRVTVRVDNTLNPDIGENSHSISDHTQGNWNGLVGRLELIATAPVWIDDLQVYPRGRDHSVSVRGRLERRDQLPWPAQVDVTIDGTAATAAASVDASGAFATVVSLAPDAAPWDEFTPALHQLTASIPGGDRRVVTFGIRDLTADGSQLRINGRPMFLRGTLDCAAYPRTGHPPMDRASWKRVFETIRAHGLNHVRFHSWCPPEEAFAAADELGMYLQVEVASWPNQSTTLGDGKPVDAWLAAETDRILRAYGNHPSLVMLCAGNEPGGDHFSPWLTAWVTRHQRADSRRLYTSGAGWPELPENDYQVTPEPRIQHWGEGLRSRINAQPPETVSDYGDFVRARARPVVSHEIGQWCVYPNFSELPKYTGYLKPRNFEIFRASLEAHGMLEQAHDFLIASGKLQVLCYKEEIESALRTPNMGGFQLLGLSDFPGQGTALVGVLDSFWEEKGYVSPAEFRRFSGPTVPLARLAKRVFTTDEHLIVTLDAAHYGSAPLRSPVIQWRIVADDGAVPARGEFRLPEIPVGLCRNVGRIDLPLTSLPAAARYKLVVTLSSPGTTGPFENDWDFWVYPAADQVGLRAPASVVLTDRFDAALQAQLEAGAKVVLMIPPSRVAADPKTGPVALGFSSIFWNTAWTSGQPPHTLGILCDPAAPALAGFPTDRWSNWQWWYPIAHAAAMNLDALPRELHPTVQVIDDWVTNRKLALVFEARIGRGRLLVTSIALDDPVLDPVRRQLRACLLSYAASDRFQPTVSVTSQQIAALIAR